jgi:hypothetical protein
VPNLAVDVDSRARSACYPRGSFYPLSTGPSTQNAGGSLSPPFGPARAVALAVKLPCAFALAARCPTVLREPLGASVTVWEATAPVKLPAWHGPAPRSGGPVRIPTAQGWYSTVGSPEPGGPGSPPPTYPLQEQPESNARVQSSSTGSFRPVAGISHLHETFNFTGPPAETAPKSLHLSCGSELTRQGISLP